MWEGRSVAAITRHRGKFTRDRSFQTYYNEVGRTEMLNAREELELFKRYKKKKDPAARDKLVNNCLRSVVKIANSYSRNPETVKDLISAGNMGILEALERYDPSHKTRFLSYATYWIQLHIRTELSNAGLVTMPAWRQKALRKVRKAKAEVAKQEGRDASDEEIREATALSETQLQRLQVDKFQYAPVDVVNPALKANDTSILSAAIDHETRDTLNAYLKALSVKEQFVVRAYFGLVLEPMSLRQIANLLGVSSERVRQIKVDALGRLKKLYKFALRVECVDELCV